MFRAQQVCPLNAYMERQCGEAMHCEHRLGGIWQVSFFPAQGYGGVTLIVRMHAIFCLEGCPYSNSDRLHGRPILHRTAF